MLVITTHEYEGKTFNRAYSNSGYLIRDAQGRHYAEAVWPLEDVDREFVETRIPVDSEDMVERPRSFNRYRMVMALKEEGVWKDIRAALLSQDEDALDMLFTAEDISEDEPLLLGMISLLKSPSFGWTDEKIESILSSALN